MDGDARARVAAVSRNEAYSFSKQNQDQIVLIAGLGVAGDVHAGATVRHRGRVRSDPGQPNLRQVHLIQGELFDELRDDGWQVEPGQLGDNVTTRGLDLLGLPRGTVLRFGRPPAGGGRGDAVSGDAVSGDAGRGDAVSGDAGRGDAVSGGRVGAVGGEVGPAGLGDGAGTVSEAVAGVLAAAGRSRLEPRAADAVAALTAAIARFESGEPADTAEPDRRAAVVVTGLRNPCGQINGLADGLLRKVAYTDAGGRFVRKAGVMGVVLRGGPVRPGDPVAVELPPSPHEPLDRV
jgi:MOSC domain-containing protein YiiM